jgi:intracellular septation protein A
MTSVHMEIPDMRTVLRHAAPRFIEGTVVPLVLFLVGLRVVGVWGAMAAGLVWVYAAIGVRLVRRRAVPGILMLGALTITARTVIALAAHSVVVYFLQPSLATMLIAGAFLLSVPLDRPLAGRLARDFCPLSDEMHANQHVRRFFRRVSLLWAFAQTCNAAITIWLLFSQSLGTFVVLRSVVSASVTITAIVASAVWFKRSMARHDIIVKLPSWRRARPAPVPA